MAVVGTWRFRLAPFEGELLSSCLVRNAHAHGAEPQLFVGLFWPGAPVWRRDIDRDPEALGGPAGAPDWIDAIGGRLGVDPAALRRATLRGWREALAGGRPPRRGDTGLLLSAGVHHRLRRRHGLQYCPECLAEGTPHYRRAWRLGFAVACEAHGGRALRDACPACDAPVVPHRTRPGRSADCHACGCALAAASRAGVGEPPVPGPVVELQRRLVAGLSGAVADEGQLGRWGAGEETFGVLRTLLAVSAAPAVQRALRHRFGLAPAAAPPASPPWHFERARWPARVARLEVVAAWLRDGPEAFHATAVAVGLTRRSFSRLRVPGVLAPGVAALPPGFARRRAPDPPLLDARMRRLRRRCPGAYRTERASRILAALGRS